jgi:hypothetical protein
MAFAFQIIGSALNAAQVDSTPQAMRIIGYDPNGNAIFKADRSAITTGNQGGMFNLGADYKVARLIRTSSDNAMRVGDSILMLYDSVEGTAVDTNKWIQTTTTMTITQAVATGTLFNASAITTTTTGAMHTSHRRFPFIIRVPLVFRARARLTATATNTVTELGFGSPATATAAAIGDGAIWRKDSTGQILPVISIGGTEILGTPISDATFRASVATTDYCFFEIVLYDNHAKFIIYKQTGELVTEQDLDWTVLAASFQVTHLQAMMRTYNSGTAGAAHQLFVDGATVLLIDAPYDKNARTVMSGMCYNSVTSPTAYTQNANWTNSAAPTTRTLSNTAAAETTLGGLLRVNSIAGGNTDLIMFGWTNPAPYTFQCTRITIPVPLNEVVAVATTATIFTYFAAFNSSAVSLATGAPYTPMRLALPGIHTAAVALAANSLFSGATVDLALDPPIAVQPGRFLHVCCRELVGTATATETYLWAGVSVQGFFE